MDNTVGPDYTYMFLSYIFLLMITLNYDKMNYQTANYILQVFLYKLHFYKMKIIEYTKKEEKTEKQSEIKEKTKPYEKKSEKFEDKYLEKFKTLPNEFEFYPYDENEETKLREHIKIVHEEYRRITMENIQFMIETTKNKLKETFEKNDLDNNSRDKKVYFVEMVSEFKCIEDCKNGCPCCNSYIEEEYENIIKQNGIQKYIETIEQTINELNDELKEIENTYIIEEELQKSVYQNMKENKIKNLINNYVIEATPLGNVALRYNSEKESFEYFSNNSMPYRYLEPVARKYVITFKCKPLFIDLEEELKHAQEKANEQKVNQEEANKEIAKKTVFAKLKDYNKNATKDNSRPQHNNMPVPSHLKSLLPTAPEKLLLKEKANRYTWEGRYSDFNPLKKIDRKIVDKKYSMTFADFKKMQESKK